jgi:predicted nucleotidyltransferase
MLLNNKELIVLKEFAGDYSAKNYGRKLAVKLKMNQKTVSNILNSLEKENILKFTQEGKNKYYYLNRLNPYAKDIVKLIEINKRIDFLERHKKINSLFLEIEKRSTGIVVVFGSYANFSETKSSDIDLFVIGEINGIKELESMYNLKLNVVKSSRDKFKLNEPFVKEIVQKHIIIKGIEEYIELTW